MTTGKSTILEQQTHGDHGLGDFREVLNHRRHSASCTKYHILIQGTSSMQHARTGYTAIKKHGKAT